MNQGSLAGDQGTGCVRSRGGCATGGRVCVQWLSQGSASAAVVAQSGLGTDRGSCRQWPVQAMACAGSAACD